MINKEIWIYSFAYYQFEAPSEMLPYSLANYFKKLFADNLQIPWAITQHSKWNFLFTTYEHPHDCISFCLSYNNYTYYDIFLIHNIYCTTHWNHTFTFLHSILIYIIICITKEIEINNKNIITNLISYYRICIFCFFASCMLHTYY